MKKTIIAFSILFSSVSFSAEKNIQDIPQCSKGHMEVFTTNKKVYFPHKTIKLPRDIVKGIKGYLKAGQVPAICRSDKRVVFSAR